MKLLKNEIEDQRAKLDAIQGERREVIDAGRRAQSEFEAQSRHVNDLKDALAAIETANQRRQGESPVRP
ncbi:hypothetical protein A4X17_11435 [Plantibacter sp. H53]|nr:hypothetical protein A4X17_11435 [Plantibacter sp. H53]